MLCMFLIVTNICSEEPGRLEAIINLNKRQCIVDEHSRKRGSEREKLCRPKSTRTHQNRLAVKCTFPPKSISNMAPPDNQIKKRSDPIAQLLDFTNIPLACRWMMYLQHSGNIYMPTLAIYTHVQFVYAGMIISVYGYISDHYSIMFSTLYHTYWYISNRGLWQQIIKFPMNALHVQ